MKKADNKEKLIELYKNIFDEYEAFIGSDIDEYEYLLKTTEMAREIDEIEISILNDILCEERAFVSLPESSKDRK